MKSKMMIVSALSLLLVACGPKTEEPVLTKTVYKVVEIDNKYYECDKIQLPNPETLDDAAVAALINDLVKANRVCYNNMQAIQLAIETSKKILEDRNND